MRQTWSGTIQDAVARSYRAAGGVEAVAELLGLANSTVSYGTEVNEHRPGGMGVNHLARLGRYAPGCAVPLAQFFAAQGGGVFHPLTATGATAADVSRITREFSEVLARHAEAHSESSDDPDDYTPREARGQVGELDDLIAAAVAFRAVLVTKIEGPYSGVKVVEVPVRGRVR